MFSLAATHLLSYSFTFAAVSLLSEIWLLLLKDLRLEWRQRSALGGLLLYVGGTVYVSYLSFSFRGGDRLLRDRKQNGHPL